jgi:hypothetical protein
MNSDTIEKCVAMVLVSILAAVGKHFGMSEGMFAAAASGIFALAGTGQVGKAVARIQRKTSNSKEEK